MGASRCSASVMLLGLLPCMLGMKVHSSALNRRQAFTLAAAVTLPSFGAERAAEAADPLVKVYFGAGCCECTRAAPSLGMSANTPLFHAS